MPGVSGVTVVTMLVCFFHFAREAAGASSARRGLRGENARVWLAVIARSEATKQSIRSQ
jgi:hypothetical protein